MAFTPLRYVKATAALSVIWLVLSSFCWLRAYWLAIGVIVAAKSISGMFSSIGVSRVGQFAENSVLIC